MAANNTNKKKKLSVAQFFGIYILILALILLGVAACSNGMNSGNTKVLESTGEVSETVTT